MKRILTFILVASLLTTITESCKKKKTDPAPTVVFLAPTSAMNRVAMLEDFTGVRCGYCPDGHVRAKAILDANPGKFVIIATNANLYANPSAGWADFTTLAGTAIDAQARPAGYPAGTMNRMACTTLGATPMNAAYSAITMGRDQWSKAATAVMAMSAPVNIGAKATFDAATRKLTVKVDLYYTATETVPNNINVALLQDKLLATQSNYTFGANPNLNYEENHVLRDMITSGNFGETISEATTTGSKVTKSYTYTVPADYHGTSVTGGGAVVVADLKVVVYVDRGQLEILNALQVDVQ